MKYTIEKKKFHTIEEFQRFQYFATRCSCDTGLYSLDSSIIVDAKNYTGIYTLDFREPILVVSESKEFFDMTEDISEVLE